MGGNVANNNTENEPSTNTNRKRPNVPPRLEDCNESTAQDKRVKLELPLSQATAIERFLFTMINVFLFIEFLIQFPVRNLSLVQVASKDQ